MLPVALFCRCARPVLTLRSGDLTSPSPASSQCHSKMLHHEDARKQSVDLCPHWCPTNPNITQRPSISTGLCRTMRKHGCVTPPVLAQPAWCCNSQIATAKSSINCPSAWRRRNKSGSTLRPWPSMPTFSSAPPSLPHDCSPHRTPNSHSSRRPDPHNLPLAAGTNRFTSPH